MHVQQLCTPHATSPCLITWPAIALENNYNRSVVICIIIDCHALANTVCNCQLDWHFSNIGQHAVEHVGNTQLFFFKLL